MSAIAGLYRRDGQPVDSLDVERMTKLLAHRGQDGTGVWNKGPVGLGHRMLWTTPESLDERLPLTNRTGDLTITADARIDNRDELFIALGLNGESRRGISDSGLILAAYERWGEGCSSKLLGDFAFAIWDGRRQTLFCVRDHAGVKPFYYYQSARTFAFGTEIKALLSLAEVPRRLDQVRVADYLAGLFEDQAITFYRDVSRLPAGHSLTVHRREARVEPYCQLDPFREIRLRSDEEYADAFRELFTEAVRCRLRSAFPVGGLLSGGLDSSSIVGTARRVLREQGADRLHTFSAIFPSLPEVDLRKIDERPFMETVLAMGGMVPHYVHADRLSPLTELDQVFWHEDEATLAPNLYMHWALYNAANQAGIRVLLDGIDGDTTVSHGLEYFSELARTGRARTLVRELRAFSRRYKTSARSVLWHFGLKPLVPEPLHRVWRVMRRSGQLAGNANVPIKAGFARRVGLAERVRSLGRDGAISPRTTRGAHWRGLTSGLYPYVLEVADKAAAAFHLQPSYPFFDRRLMEFCLALPPEQKLQQGWSRVIMRRAMADTLPHTVRWRVWKANLGPNFRRQLFECDRGLLDDVIVRDPQVLEDYVDVPALRDVYDRCASQPMSRDALAIYVTVTLALWLRRTGLTT